MATEDIPLHVYDGDIIQLYCPLESGYVYSEPNSTSDLDLSIVSKEKIKVADFAAFSITLKKESENKEKHSSSKEKAKSEETERIAYGSVICVKHQASGKFLIANDENEVKLSSSDDAKSLFRVVSPNHELEWGNLLKDNDPIKLECNRSSLFVNFNYVHQRKCYKPTLKANGTVFDVQMYCHKQNSKSIKGGSPIIISTLLNIEGYLCATGSFFSSKIDEIESTRPLEEPSASYGRSLEEPTEQQSRIEQQSGVEQPDEQPKYSLTKEGHGKEGMKVDLCKFMEGSFKKLPEYGDAFFQLERVSGPFGSPILFGEECRIKQLFSFKYLAIKSSPAQKVVLCDFNEENESNVIFKVLSVSGSIDHEEVCDFDKVTFQHVKSSKYLSVDLRIRHGQGKRFDLTANEDSGVLKSQFKVSQVKKYLLMDSYYALGLSSFLYDSYIMLQDKDKTLVPMCVIQNEIEKKMIELEEKQCRTSFIFMLKNLGVVIKELLVKKQVKNHCECFYLCVTKVSQEEVDSEPTQTIDPHIQKKIYEKSLEQSDTEKAPEILVEQFHDLNAFMIDAEQLLMNDGKFENGIENIIKCLKKYATRRPGSANEPRPDQISIDMTHGHRDPTDSEVHQLLLLLHLLFTKCKALPVNLNNQSSTSKSTGTNNEIELTGFWSRGQTRVHASSHKTSKCHSWCTTLSQLVANEDCSISYMSASLIFEIYMKEQTDGSKSALASKGNGDLMTDENLLLIKKMLLNDKNSKKDIINFLKGFTSQDNSVSPRNVALVYNSGLFHIVLEYALKHIVYSRIDEEVVDLLCCCFKLLRGIAASNKEIRNEMFLYFSNFLQFKQVTNDMICLINEIFYGNTYVCNKLTKYDLGKVLYAAIIGPFDHYQWTIVLQTIIENSDQVEAQEHIAQLISKHSNDYLQHVLCPREQSKATYWLKILQCDKIDENERQKNECHLLLNITDLLASCASGECQSARLVAMKLFTFNNLIEILMSEDVIMYRKLPFIRILTVTYLFDGSHFTANCSQYKKLWSHINKTIMRFVLVEDKSITSKSHWAIHQQIVDGGKYMQPDRELEHVMELLYITDGVIPFLSKVCHEMSHQSSEKHICTKEELQSLREQLELLKNYRFVSEQLNTSGHIGRINSLLEKYEINCLVATTWPASDGSINQTDSADNKIKFVRRDRSMPIEPQSNYYKEIYNLLKANNKNVRTVVILALKNLVELQKIKSLTYFKRIDVEETILRMLVLLQTVIKEAVLPSEKYSLNEKKLFKSVLYLNDHSNKEHTIFHLLQSQNNEVIFQVVKMLKCFEEAPKEVGAPKKVQKKMISSCKAHDNVYIVQVHRLLREAHTIYNANHSQNDSATPDELKNTERGITAALDIIILLCDRQHRVMQDAMRNSKVFISGSNVVSQVALLLFYITEHLDENNGIIAHTAVKALVKMCTGNYNNQHIAYKGQVVTSINCILEKNGESFAELKSSCIKLLEVMLEEIDENSSKLAIFIADHLKIDKLYQEMRDLWKLKVSIEYTMEDTLKLCRVYHILKRIADYKGRNIDKLICPDKEDDEESVCPDKEDDEESVCSDKEDDEESGCPAKKDDEESGCPDKKDDEVHQAMWKCCEQWSRSVEIVYKLNEDKDIVTRAYFPFTPHLHIKGKNDIQLEIKRSTPQEKLLDLIKLTKAVGKTHKIKDNFRNSLCIVNTPPNYNMPDTNDGVCTANETYNETCNNSTSSSPMYFQPIWYPDIPVWSTIILGILGFIHFILAVLMVIEYFYRNGRNLTLFSCQELCYGSLKMLLGRYLIHRLHIQEPRQSNKFYKIPFFSFQPLYRIFFTICSFVAWIPYPPLSGLRYLYCLCILYPFLKFDVMSFISRAIKKSIKRLASVFLLCFIFIYIYAVISFAFLNNYFSEDRDQFCGSLLQCFFTVSRLGLLSTLGSELDIRPSDYEPDFKLYVFRTFYDLIFFIVVTTLGLSIITATLVDRFSEMREKSDEVNEDNESRCFICSIERSKFDKNFKTHVEKEHNMWNYMRFIMYVKHCCHENDHNALEKYVYEKVKDEGKESIDFFPLHRAKSLLHYKHQDSATEEQSTQLQQASEELRRQGLVVRHEADRQTEDMRRRNTT